MAGHTSERRWRRNQTQNSGQGFSEQVTELVSVMLDVLYKAEQLGLELEEMQDYLEDESAQALADQLFKEEWSVREADPLANPGIFEQCANEDEVTMVADAMAAVEAAKQIFEFANKKESGKTRIAKMRRMA